MDKKELTNNEKQILYGLVRYPKLPDKRLSDLLNIKHSTVTSIRHRLRQMEYYRGIKIPKLENMGCELFVIIYTNFSPLIPLEERIEITGQSIEVFDEIFLSIGEQDKGFSLSLSKDFTTIGKINDIRTQTFGGRGILESEYPNIITFPFKISKFYRFFNYSYLLKKYFSLNLDLNQNLDENIINYDKSENEKSVFSDTEKDVFCMLIKYPELSDTFIGRELGVSRHTVSRFRRDFESENLIKMINLPNLGKLGFEILTLFHIKFDPCNPPNLDLNEPALLMNDSTILMTSRMFEAFMISIHENYEDYKKDVNRIMQILKENNWISAHPTILSYSLSSLIYIKEFKFAPISRKILGCDLLI